MAVTASSAVSGRPVSFSRQPSILSHCCACDCAPRFRPAVAEKLQGIPHILDLFEVKVGNQEFSLVSARLAVDIKLEIERLREQVQNIE